VRQSPPRSGGGRNGRKAWPNWNSAHQRGRRGGGRGCQEQAVATDNSDRLRQCRRTAAAMSSPSVSGLAEVICPPISPYHQRPVPPIAETAAEMAKGSTGGIPRRRVAVVFAQTARESHRQLGRKARRSDAIQPEERRGPSAPRRLSAILGVREPEAGSEVSRLLVQRSDAQSPWTDEESRSELATQSRPDPQLISGRRHDFFGGRRGF
jgi:Rod binding domain-containing protein